MDDLDPDKVLMDHRVIEALRNSTTPPSDDQLYRMLAAWRDIVRDNPPTPSAASGWYEDRDGRWRHSTDDTPTGPAYRLDGWCEDRTPGHELTDTDGVD